MKVCLSWVQRLGQAALALSSREVQLLTASIHGTKYRGCLI